MSFTGLGAEEESLGWGAISPPVEEMDLVSQAIRKEKLIKCVLALLCRSPGLILRLFSFREIKASQEGLRGWFSIPIANVSKAIG